MNEDVVSSLRVRGWVCGDPGRGPGVGRHERNIRVRIGRTNGIGIAAGRSAAAYAGVGDEDVSGGNERAESRAVPSVEKVERDDGSADYHGRGTEEVVQ